jgi:exopolysaccharide biosynthesis WecB/TagA/CpsF family protein
MIDKGRKSILGVLVDAVDYEAAVEKIIRAGKDKLSFSVSALAVHGIMTGVLDPVQRYRLNHLDMAVADGQPVRWALNLLYRCGLSDRVRGPALMFKVCERFAKEGLPIYLYGSTQEVINSLSLSLKARFPGLIIAGSQPSFFRKVSLQEKQEIIRNIIKSKAAVVFVGLGCPRQENWVYTYRDGLAVPLVAVGAAFDFLSGNVSQAPLFLQRFGLEWCFRLLHEPRRLWKRYLLLNPLYLTLLFLQAFGLMSFDQQGKTPEDEQLPPG